MNDETRAPANWPFREVKEFPPNITVELMAKGLRRERTGLHGQVALKVDGVAVAVDTFNLERMKGGRSDFVTGVLKRVQELDHGIYLEALGHGALAVEVDRFCLGILNTFADGEPFVILGEREPAPRPAAIENLIRQGEATRLFGEKGSGKSFLAQAIAMSVQTGAPLLGLQAEPGAALYLDWETDSETLDSRLFALSRGFGLTEPPRIRYRRMTAPLSEDLDAVRAHCQEYDVRLVVIDSAGLAGDPDEPESARAALRLAAALRQLRQTVLIIDHVAKDDKGTAKKRSPYGSVYKINTDRSVFELRSAQDEYDGTLHLGLFHRWANNVRLHKPRGWRLHIDGSAAIFSPEDVRSVPLLAENLSAGARAWAVLKQPMTTSQLAEELDLAVDTIAKGCKRHPYIIRADGGGRGAEVLWSRLSEAEQ